MKIASEPSFSNFFCHDKPIFNHSEYDITVELLKFSWIYLLIMTGCLALFWIFKSWRKRRFCFHTELDRSIFGGYGGRASIPRIILYYYIMYGVFYYKIFGSLFVILMSDCAKTESDFLQTCAHLLDVICDFSNFFVMMFILNLYGFKWEMLVRLGYPVVPKDQHEKFVDLCLKKALIFTAIFAVLYMLTNFYLEGGRIAFDYTVAFSSYKFIKNFVIATLIYQRTRLINYYKETSTYTKINQAISEEINLRIRVVDDYFPNAGSLMKEIRNAKDLKSISKWLKSKIEGSDLIIKEKLHILRLNSAKPRDPIPINYRERYFLNNFVLGWLFVDTTVFTVGCFYLTLCNTMFPSGVLPAGAHEIALIIVKTLLIFSYFEFTIQSVLFYNVLKDKRVLGEEMNSNTPNDLDSSFEVLSRQSHDYLILEGEPVQSPILLK